MDVWPGVFASGILLVPKDVKPGEKRPVVGFIRRGPRSVLRAESGDAGKRLLPIRCSASSQPGSETLYLGMAR